MSKARLPKAIRAFHLLGLLLAIPAFYLVLPGADQRFRPLGAALYGAMALSLCVDLVMRRGRKGVSPIGRWEVVIDVLVLFGAIASAWPTPATWLRVEWFLRLAFCAVVFARLLSTAGTWVAPKRLLPVLTMSLMLWAIAGAGFYWLEPKVNSYADGLWLAFMTGATVGYGDLVPSVAASRIFAVFIVLLGYGLFSFVTASISALFVSEDEKELERALHADIRALKIEIAGLRHSLQSPGREATDKAAAAADGKCELR